MIAFDTDILTEVLIGIPTVAARAALIPAEEQTVPIIVIEEVLRGRLEMIRRAESAKARVTIEIAYQLFEQTITALHSLRIISYTPAAEALFRHWRQSKMRGSTHDLRIAAIAVVHAATLVTRNRRDFEHIPGLSLEVWA
jgi:tRNA(fMet)-specific endonuclease VapC